MLKRLFFLSLLPFYCSADELPAPVKAIEKQGITIIKPFEAPGGMKGWLGKYQDMGVAIYLTPDGKHAISGYMYDESGTNLSEQLFQQELYTPAGQEMWKKLESADDSVRFCRSLLPLLPTVLATGSSVGRIRESSAAHPTGWRHKTGKSRSRGGHPGQQRPGENLASL